MSKTDFAERLALALAKGFQHGAAFVLAEEVRNPTPDRRHTHDWRRLANIPAGKRFRVVEERHNDHAAFANLDEETRQRLITEMEKKRRFVLQPCNERHAAIYPIRLWSDSDAALWDAIVPNLIPDERSFDDVMWRADEIGVITARDILEHLVETKRLTFLDIDIIVDEVAAKQNLEEEKAS